MKRESRTYLGRMRRVVVVSVLCVLLGCGAEDEERPAAPRAGALADLRISVDRDGDRGPQPARETVVRCVTPAETPACDAALALRPEHFAPPPDNVACTLQYGGPDTARVTGTLRGERVDARFSRTDGCEINRWERVRKLLEQAG
jgi:hypothetical protein